MRRLVGQELTCVRGGRTVFEGLSFWVAAGEALAVVGRNGAGKSSLLRLICGLIRPEAGTLVAEGAAADVRVAELCHYAGHADALKPALTTIENLAFWRDFTGDRGEDPIDALDRLGVAHLADLPAGYLSAGQKRRVTLARLFVTRRPIWLLDEPTAALDVRTQAALTAEMRRHLADGGVIIVATHSDLDITPMAQLEIGA